MLVIIMVFPSVQLLTTFAESSLLDVWLGSEYTSSKDIADKESWNVTGWEHFRVYSEKNIFAMNEVCAVNWYNRRTFILVHPKEK